MVEKKDYEFGFPNEEDVDKLKKRPRLKVKKEEDKEKKKNKSEEECRRIFNKIFDNEFKSVRPVWLKNPATGKCLELDGYCSEIETPSGQGLAFEYDGQQHSKFTPHFHNKGGVKEFEYQVAKDTWKDKMCEKNGVMLIRIPYYVNFNEIEKYIKHKLKQKKVIPTYSHIEAVDNISKIGSIYR